MKLKLNSTAETLSPVVVEECNRRFFCEKIQFINLNKVFLNKYRNNINI